MPTPIPFTGMTLDRASVERKDPTEVARLLEDPGTRAVAAGHDGVLISDGALARIEHRPHDPLLLGLDQSGRALFALDLDELPHGQRESVIDRGRLVTLREAGVTLAQAEAGLAAYAAALLHWHRRHRFCANCGAATLIEEGGHARRCPRCETVHFPRTDPVVIMSVEFDGKLLLGRRAISPPGRYSVLAGFVSPGESAEEAVVREVQEESGIAVREPSYVSSQPWPFPSSLMLGFHAHADGGEPRARDGELEQVRWFPREEVEAASAERNPRLQLPPPVSIARVLIERWLERSER